MPAEHPPLRRAVALEYDPSTSPAPLVSAAGQGYQAEEIIRVAREAGVPVLEDPALAGVLARLEIGRVIPPELYVAVAEVLAYLYRLSRDAAPHPVASTEGNNPPARGNIHPGQAERDGKRS